MNFPLLVHAEFVKLNSRISAKLGLLVSIAVGFVLPLVLFGTAYAIRGSQAELMFDTSTTRPMVWGLYVRNLLVVRAFLVVLGAQALAGELAAQTVREDLLRPVPRYAVFMAKWLAIIGWDALSLLATFLVSAVFGLGLFGLDGMWTETALAYLINLVCDAGVIAVVLAFAAVTRSNVATIAGVVVGLVGDKALGVALPTASTAAEFFQASPLVVELINQWPILPSAAFAVWTFPLILESERLWISVASLFFIMASSLLIGLTSFKRMMVP